MRNERLGWIALGLLMACGTRAELRVLAEAQKLESGRTVLEPEPQLRMTAGAQHELCLDFSANIARATQSSATNIEAMSGSPMRRADGQVVRFSARFVGADGQFEEVVPHGWGLAGDIHRVCFHPTVERDSVRRVELYASDSIMVERITWFDGIRRPASP